MVCEAYVLGVSTRRVEELVEAMGATGMSKSEVSRMAETLDEQVADFRERRLDDVVWPYVNAPPNPPPSGESRAT